MSRREPLTIVVWGGEDRRATRRFVGQLALDVEPGDQVVLFGPGRDLSSPGAWRTVAAGRSLRRVPEGASPPRPHRVVVVVDDRSTVSDHWIDRLATAFEDPTVGVAAPRTNVADGDELLIGVPYRPTEPDERSRFVRRIGESTAAEMTEGGVVRVGSLAGPCVALQRSLLGSGGLAEWSRDPHIAEWSQRATDRGLHSVVVERAYAHHPGGPSRYRSGDRTGLRPLVSACLIVKDEAENLPRCLASLAGLADEVIVYDTGSSDSSVTVARHAGARVIEGYWDNDFSRARNEALASCRGRWILWLDADEALACEDPAALRVELQALGSDTEGFLVLIDNLRGNDASTVLTHPGCRLFRRCQGRWEGRVHEQVVARAGSVDLSLQLLGRARITHWGYLQSAMNGRGKAQRNLRSALGDLAGGSQLDRGARLLNLGRSHLLAGHHREGVDLCRRAAATASYASTVRLAVRGMIEGLLALDQPTEALEEIDRLRRISSVPSLADLLEGRARLALEQPERALDCFDRVQSGLDDDGFEYGPRDVAAGRAQALAGLGRDDEAADTLLDSLRRDGGLDAHVGLLVESLQGAGRSLGEIPAAIAPDRSAAFIPQLLQLQPAVADAALDAWYLCDMTYRPALAAAAVVGPRLSVDRQLVWSHRLRSNGLPAACPLVRSATDLMIPAGDRLLAAATAAVAFLDPRGRQAFAATALSLPPEDRVAYRAAVSALDPELAVLMDQAEAMRRFAEDRFAGSDQLKKPPSSSAPTGRPPSSSAPAGRQVLVVDREVSSIRSLALAVALRAAGHDVTLAQPQPAAPSADLLESWGVAVHGWAASDPDWMIGAGRLVARLYAERPFDVVVLGAKTGPLVSTVHRLLPAAAVVVDLDHDHDHDHDHDLDLDLDHEEAPNGAEHAEMPGGSLRNETVDLFVSAQATIESQGTGPTIVAATADTVFGRPPATPLAVRSGLVIVGNFRTVADTAQRHWVDIVAPALSASLPPTAAAVVGDDPAALIAGAMPMSIAVGPLADPTPWLRAARVVLVPFMNGAEHWLAAAAACGTPALLLPEDPSATRTLVEAVAALVTNDELWHRFAPDALVEVGDLPPPVREGQSPVARSSAVDPLSLLPPRSIPPRGSGRDGVRWVGPIFAHSSLAHVNRELVSRLSRLEGLPALRAVTNERGAQPADSMETLSHVHVAPGGPSDAPSALEIRHQWPPDFTPVRSGRLVLMQPWEFGGLPAEWIGPVRDVIDELWVPTTWVRDRAVESGIPARKVAVVPNGVDSATYRPDGPRFALATTKGTRLLFVGGCIPRKGIDALLETYLATFTEDDDVCLVVKPFGSSDVYRNSSVEADVRRAAAGRGASIELVDGDLSDADMAALYRSCDALVHPYRGEGFGMPIAEAMASGLAVVVTGGGAADDFCDADTGWIIPSRRVDMHPGDWTPTGAGTWWLEPDRQALAAAMVEVLGDPDKVRHRGGVARARIVERFSWDVVARAVAARIVGLLDGVASPGRSAGPADGHHRTSAPTPSWPIEPPGVGTRT